MTQGQTKVTTKYDLVFDGASQQQVALVVLCKKSSLASVIEKAFGVSFDGRVLGKREINQVGQVTVYGKPGSAEEVKKVFDTLAALNEKGMHYSSVDVMEDIIAQIKTHGKFSPQFSKAAANQNRKNGGSAFVAKTAAQGELYDLIEQNDITFATGPAGTGKTHVAVTRAVEALKANQVKRIILARPAVEAGEKLGFLPGTERDKVDPYMRPLYDILYQHYTVAAVKNMIDSGTIEIAPVAFMRGRTLAEAFIVIDEAQNCTRPQLKMILTRFGDGSKMVVTGDHTQNDLPPGHSGLVPAVEALKGKEGIGALEFSAADVVRHRVVQTVVEGLGPDFDTIPEAPRRSYGAPRQG